MPGMTNATLGRGPSGLGRSDGLRLPFGGKHGPPVVVVPVEASIGLVMFLRRAFGNQQRLGQNSAEHHQCESRWPTINGVRDAAMP